jgi:predicted nucleotidyltransferase
MENKLKTVWLLWHNSKGIHLRELSRLLDTGFPNAVRYATLLEREGVVLKEKDANTIKLKLREGTRTIAYLKQVNSEEFLGIPKKVQSAVTDFLNELEEKPLIALLFGSYAKKNYTSQSDVDILLVYQKVQNEKSIENTSKRISMRSNVKLSPIYVDYASFEKNFLDKKHDFSKEIRQDAIVLLGTEYFFPLWWRFWA